MIEDPTTQLRRGVAEFCVLGLLDSKAMYGWELSSALTEQRLIASIGTLYPLLARLRTRGLIETFEQPSPEPIERVSGPTRKYYRLTEAGREQLKGFREQWGPFTQSVSNIISGGSQ